MLDNTLLIVVTDHGEEFWDHGFTAHGHSLYQELLHSVFVMWNPKLLPQPARIAEPVQLIDLMPTLLDLLEIPADGVIQGQSLLPLLRGQPFRRRNYVAASKLARPEARGFIPENSTESVMLLDARWKLIHRSQAKRAGLSEAELYDRTVDRAEKNGVAAKFPAEAGKLVGEVRSWIAAQDKVRALVGRGTESKLDPAALQRLRSLGGPQ